MNGGAKISKAEELYNDSAYRFDLGLFAEHILYEAEKLAGRTENGQYMCEKCACEAYFIYKCLMELQERRQNEEKSI